MIIGLLCGYTIQLLFLLLLLKKKLHWNFGVTIKILERKVLHNIIFAQLGNITSVLSSYIPLYILSGFGAGIITSLNYGQKIADIPTQFITMQFSSVIGIKLNELYAKNEIKTMNDVFVNSSKALLFILIPISCFLFLYAHDIIALLLQRGNFDSEAVQQTVVFFKYFCLLLPFLAINTLVSRIFMAAQKIKEAFWYQIIMNGVLIGLIYVLVMFYGVIGYPIALIILHSLSVFFIFFLF